MYFKYIIAVFSMSLKAIGQELQHLITQNSDFKQTHFLGTQHGKAIKDEPKDF